MYSFVFKVSVLCALIAVSDGAKILFFFPSGAFSHKVSIWPLVSALADKGHEVTFLSGYGKAPFHNPKIKDLESSTLKERLKKYYDIDRLGERQRGADVDLYTNYNYAIVNICHTLFNNSRSDPVLRKVIYEEPYDLIVNNFILSDCGLIVANRKNAKLITYLSSPWFSWINLEVGFPLESSWIPDCDRKVQFPMSLWDRARNFLTPYLWYYSRITYVYPELEGIMMKHYGLTREEVPSLLEVQKNVSLILSASHYGTDFPRSLPPMVVQVGGMQCWRPYEPLTGEFKTILDNAIDGAILIAFGSTVNLATMPQHFKDVFFQMMRKFPKVQFIWRWDGPDPEDKPENLVVAKWLPQFQILAHPNLKAFVSHAGLNSLTEATYNGVPVILLPLFADQDYNGYRIQATEIGIRLEAKDLSLSDVTGAISAILNEPKYAHNMKRMSEMMRDRPVNPLDTAVFWTEFVLRHDNVTSLKPLQHLTWYQRNYVDAILLLYCITVMALVAVWFCVVKALAYCRKSSPAEINSNAIFAKKRD